MVLQPENLMTTSLPSVSLLGLGIIGAEWAKNLAADGVPLRTWNRTPKPDAPGFTADAADAARGTDLVIILVSDPAAVTAVLDQIVPALKPGQLVAQASTVSAAWNLTFAARVKETGADFLEIPFTG